MVVVDSVNVGTLKVTLFELLPRKSKPVIVFFNDTKSPANDLNESGLLPLNVRKVVTLRNTNVVDQLDTVGVYILPMEPKLVRNLEDLLLKVASD